MSRTLYICYFGLREPLVQTQVLTYLRELRKDGIEITLLTFEPELKKNWSSEQIEEKKTELAEAGIDWHMLPYHKRPSLPATAYDVLNGVRYIRKLLRKTQFDVLHARVHIPALIAVLVRKLSRRKPKILFDIRGFVPEEYADAGVWKEDGMLFRLAKKVEDWIMKESDGFVVLTEAARDVLFPESRATGYERLARPVEVIPCCVDFKKRFSGSNDELRRLTRDKLNLEGRTVIIHVGSLVGLYLTPQIIEFLKVAKRRDPSVFALFLTQSNPEDIVSRLLAAGYSENDFLVTKVDQKDVPAYLCASDIGLSFVQSSYATLSRSPTKIPEYLACGLPVIANAGVGDVDTLITANGVGAIVDELNVESYEKALDEVALLDGVRNRAIATAHREFDLAEVGGKSYRRLYRRMAGRRFKALYISYFGINEPLVQTQVLPYLREVAKGIYGDDGMTARPRQPPLFPLLTFEPVTSLDTESMKAKLASEGIDWYCLPYHKRVSAVATAWDILRGVIFVHRFINRERPDVLHGRVHIATLIGAIARKFSRHKPKILFDIRGFFPEEYTDAGVWPAGGFLFRSAKRVEKWLMKESDGFVVLTEKARDILFPESAENGRDARGRPVEVIPCCVDLEKFGTADDATRRMLRADLDIEKRRVIAYVGSFGGWYLTENMLDLFAAAREHDPSTFVMILTQRNSQEIEERLRARGFGTGDYYVDSVEPSQLPRYLVGADAAVSFIKACYSKQSSSPTKIAEYLACGVPIIANRGVGDIDELIAEHRIGTLVDDFSNDSYLLALSRIDELGPVAERCRKVAFEQFDLGRVAGEKYRRLYGRLIRDNEERAADVSPASTHGAPSDIPERVN